MQFFNDKDHIKYIEENWMERFTHLYQSQIVKLKNEKDISIVDKELKQ